MCVGVMKVLPQIPPSPFVLVDAVAEAFLIGGGGAGEVVGPVGGVAVCHGGWAGVR